MLTCTAFKPNKLFYAQMKQKDLLSAEINIFEWGVSWIKFTPTRDLGVSHGLPESFLNIGPVCYVEDCFDIVRSHILVLQVVGMFPYINAIQRDQS